MRILGINYLSESSVSLLENGKIKYSISEERINRVKNWWGNPFKSINYMLKDLNLTIKDIDIISTHGLIGINQKVPLENEFEEKKNEIHNSKLRRHQKNNQLKNLESRYYHEKKVAIRTKKYLSELKKKFKNLEIHDHHDSHAATAYYFSGWKECHVLTIDGWGDQSSSKFYHAKKGNLKEITRSYTLDSLGYFYGSITKLLGFKPHQHEGKILGLAAFGNKMKAYKEIAKMISFDKKNNCFKGNYEKGLYIASFENKNLNFLLKKYSKKDIAAATQKRLEDVVLDFIKYNIKKKTKLALAGGVFANVKLNQKISELNKIEKIFVFPNMGDGGLSVGTAALSFYKKKKYLPRKIDNMYLGPKFSNKEILNQIKKYKLKALKIKNPSKFIANEISEGKVVGIFQGRMEFGPRSLGNRSIIVQAKDVSVNDWLNKKLKRTEFMPFAPITLIENKDEYYKDIQKKELCMKFMTITVDCKKKALAKFPAAVHIDNTARPQLIDKKYNSLLYDLILNYKKITNSGTLINTSFNMHEEPIVCSPKDALRAFKLGNLDYLFIGNYILKN
jgi:carbamoyltransferase